MEQGAKKTQLSLPAWGAWIEIQPTSSEVVKKVSLPAWGAWIEIEHNRPNPRALLVAPRVGSVD